MPRTNIGDISYSLTDVLVSPGFITNLIYIGQLIDNNCHVKLSNSSYLVQDQRLGKIIAKGPKVGLLFRLHLPLSSGSDLPFISCNYGHLDYHLWYKRLGHPNSHVLHAMLKSSFLGNKDSPSLHVIQFDCISCKLGKSKILPFPKHQSIVGKPIDMIHSDVWEITLVPSHAKYKYFVIFVDDYSRLTWVYFLWSKHEDSLHSNFILLMFRPNFLPKLKLCDMIMEGVYISFISSHGIISQRSYPSTP